MIFSSLQFIVLLVFSVQNSSSNQPFYVINVPLLEQCATNGRVTQLNTFTTNQLSCFYQNARQISITIEYICQSNSFKNIWTLKSEKNSATSWPVKIHVLTVHGQTSTYTLHQVLTGTNREKETITETPFQFQSTHNPLTMYLWVADVGPYCRLKTTIPNDICKEKAGQRYALKATQFVCVYNKVIYSLQNAAERTKLNTFIDGNFKTVTNTATSKPSPASGSKNSTGGSNGDENGSNSQIEAQGKDGNSFFEKYKNYIMIGGGALGVIVVLGIVMILIRRSSSSSSNGKNRKSAASLESAGTTD